MRFLIALVAALITALIPICLAARIYIWTDKEGVKHFSQEPPPEHATEVKIENEIRQDTSAGAKQFSPASAHGQPAQTRILLEGKSIFVPVTLVLGDHQVNTLLVLDTGASSTVLNSSTAERLGIQLAMNTKVQVAGGELIDAQNVTLDSLSVGPHTLGDLPILVIHHEGPQISVQGFLGLDFLGQFLFSIDLRKMVIRWGGDIPAMGP